MSYNLLFDTNFSNIKSKWKLTDCEYVNGCLKGNSKVYSIEQEITLPDPTRLYFSFDYICFDKNIKHIYCGIASNDGVMETNRKKPHLHKRKRVGVVASINTEKVKILIVIEAKTPTSSIYIDSPLLIDLHDHNKSWWPVKTLNKWFDYRYGYDYINLYKECELSLNNKDFYSPYTKTEQGKIGIIVNVKENDWFELTDLKLIPGKDYLVKLDYEEINDFGTICLQYGDYVSNQLNKEQLYIIFKSDSLNKLKLNLQCKEPLPYMVNLKNILAIDLTSQKIDYDDISHLPFI